MLKQTDTVITMHIYSIRTVRSLASGFSGNITLYYFFLNNTYIVSQFRQTIKQQHWHFMQCQSQSDLYQTTKWIHALSCTHKYTQYQQWVIRDDTKDIYDMLSGADATMCVGRMLEGIYDGTL